MPWLTPTTPYAVPKKDSAWLAMDPNQVPLEAMPVSLQAGMLPLPQDQNQSLNQNLIAQLEAAKYGQSLAKDQQPVQMADISPPAPQQVATQPQINKQTQSSMAMAPESDQGQLSPQQELFQAYGKQQELQNAAIKQAEEQLAAARSKPQQLDISPLIALSQSWSQNPSQLLAAYQRPDDQAKTVQALQEAVLKARGGAADIAAKRAMDVAKLDEAKAAREQRLQELSLKKQEVSALKESNAAQKAAQQQTEWKEKFDKRFGDNMSGLAEMAQNAKIAKDIISKKGRLPVYGDPEWAEYSSAVSSMLTRYNADKAKLGALAGSDLKLLEGAVGTSIDSFDNLAKNVAGGGAAGSIKVLDKVLKGSDQTVNNIGNRAKAVYGDQVMDVYKQSKSYYDESRGLSGSQPSKPTKVIQNGVTYTLNPQTGEYE